VDVNILPVVCSYEACGNCTKYGTFPCAWCVPGLCPAACFHLRPPLPAGLRSTLSRVSARRYKILFIVVGLAGLYFTRGLYNDREVTYMPRSQSILACECCGFRTAEQQQKSRK
jgi:hypothetical protein